MLLSRIEYKEWEGNPREWIIDPTSFGDINLLVGKNTSGKSRLLNVMSGLARLFSGKQQTLFSSGDYKVTLTSQNGPSYEYEVSLKENNAVREILRHGSDFYIERNGSGPGKIKTSPSGEHLDFQVKPTQLAVTAKRDSLQYPYLEEIATWAEGTEHYEFGTLFGPNAIGMPGMVAPIEFLSDPEKILQRNYAHKENLPVLFAAGLSKYADFKRSVCDDMNHIGYELEDMGMGVLSAIQMKPPAIGMWIKERDLRCNTEQTQMSLGMFRAFATIVRLNLIMRSAGPSTLFLDDVGEGLDYARSVALIELLMSKAKEGQFQLFMTSNDRFVMNEVPIEHWSVLLRTGHHVRVKNFENSRDEFRKFQKLGLNNFDYFVSHAGAK